MRTIGDQPSILPTRRQRKRISAEALRKPQLPAVGTANGQMNRSPRATEIPFPTVQASNVAPDDMEALRDKRVVICEDEGINQMQLRRAVTRAGMKVVGLAANGRDGLDASLRERPDIVLMDIRMPGMDGLEAAERILQQIRACIVMLTAFSDQEYQDRALAFGAAGYIVKPVTGDSLLPQLAEAWKRFRAGE